MKLTTAFGLRLMSARQDCGGSESQERSLLSPPHLMPGNLVLCLHADVFLYYSVQVGKK